MFSEIYNTLKRWWVCGMVKKHSWEKVYICRKTKNLYYYKCFLCDKLQKGIYKKGEKIFPIEENKKSRMCPECGSLNTEPKKYSFKDENWYVCQRCKNVFPKRFSALIREG